MINITSCIKNRTTKSLCVFLATLLVLSVFLSELVEAQTYPCNCQLRWNYLSNGRYNGKVNYSNLSTSYQATAGTSINDWNNSTYNNNYSTVLLTNTSLAYSNIDLITYANTWPLGNSVYAITIQQFTNSYWHRPGLSANQFSMYTPSATCQLAKRYIQYAAILVTNTNPTFLSTSPHRRYVFSHEIGHALGLTHRSGTSIMNTNTTNIASYVPASVDYSGLQTDINNY